MPTFFSRTENNHSGKRNEEVLQANETKKKIIKQASVTILITDIIDFKQNLIRRD